jgi:hypothetical protein
MQKGGATQKTEGKPAAAAAPAGQQSTPAAAGANR